MKNKYIGLLIGVFSFAFIMYGALNANTSKTLNIYKYHTEVDSNFGKTRQLNNAGGQVVIANQNQDVLDGGLGSDIFIIDKGFSADRIVAARDAFAANDVLEINFSSNQAAFMVINEVKIKGKRHVELGLHYFELSDPADGEKHFTSFSKPLAIDPRAIDKFIFKDGTVVYYKDILELNLPVNYRAMYSPVFSNTDWIKSWFK